MGIKVEFNPDLALRNIAEFKNGNREIEECIPENLEVGKEYLFFKKEQRLYWFYGEIPLRETQGNQVLSKPKASVFIVEAIHFLRDGEVCTKGKYRVIEIFNDNEVHFDGFNKIENDIVQGKNISKPVSSPKEIKEYFSSL